jgi:hypothetical protein
MLLAFWQLTCEVVQLASTVHVVATFILFIFVHPLHKLFIWAANKRNLKFKFFLQTPKSAESLSWSSTSWWRRQIKERKKNESSVNQCWKQCLFSNRSRKLTSTSSKTNVVSSNSFSISPLAMLVRIFPRVWRPLSAHRLLLAAMFSSCDPFLTVFGKGSKTRAVLRSLCCSCSAWLRHIIPYINVYS